MKKVKTSARISEVDALSDSLLRIYNDFCSSDASVAGDSNLVSIFNQINEYSQKITTAIKQDKISTSLEEVDSKRDGYIRQLGKLLTGYAAFPTEEKAAVGERLLTIFNKYGRDITKKSLVEESSLIESLLEDFNADSVSEAVTSLDGITEVLSNIRAAQDDFYNASDSASLAISTKGESANSLRKPLLTLINGTLIPYLSAIETLNFYKAFTAQCETEIEKINSLIERRTSTSSESTETSATSET